MIHAPNLSGTSRISQTLLAVFLCAIATGAEKVFDPPVSDSLASDTLVSNSAIQTEDTGETDSIPRLISFAKADYPASAISQGIEGPVLLDLLVSDSGTVDSVAVVKTVDTALGKAAAAAARKFRFTPARFNGEPEAVILQYEYRFSLDDIADTIPTVINCTGTLLEYGTRKRISDAIIRIAPLDTGLMIGNLPMVRYLQRLSAAGHYQFDHNAIIVTSDSLGRFSCRALPACVCSVKVIAPGYQTFAEGITINKDQRTDATWYVRPLGFGNENEIVVYGIKESSQVSHHALTQSETRRVPGFSGDAIRVIQAMPGVSRSTFGGGQLMVRGSGPFDNKFYIDGIEVPYVYHTVSSQAITESVYNGYLLSRVDFYPGGFDTRYGGAIGGVVDIVPRKSRTDALHGCLDLSMLVGSIALEGPISPTMAVSGSYRRSYLNLYNSMIESIVPGITKTPYYQDYLARLDVSPGKSHRMFLSILGADDGVELVDNEVRGGSTEVDSAVNTLRFNTGFKLLTLGSDYKGTGRISNTFRLGVRPMSGNISAFGQFKYSIKSGMVYSLRNTATFKPNERFNVHGGLDIAYKTGTGSISFVDTMVTKITKTLEMFFGGPFITIDWMVSKKLTVSPGIRYDLHYPLEFPGTTLPEFWDYSRENTSRIKGVPALRVKAGYAASPRHSFDAATGTYTALPHTSYSFAGSLFGDEIATFEVINPISGKMDAQLIHGQQNIIGYTWTPDPLFSMGVQAYLNDQWNVTRYAEWEEYNQGPVGVWYRDDGKARMKGVELLIRRNEGKRFFGWISYTLSQSEEYNPWTRAWSKRDWDVTNYLQAISAIKITPNLDFGIRLRYSDGFWYTPITGRQFYDEDWSWYRLERAQPKSKRLVPYINADLRLERRFSTKWANAYLSLEGVNLVNLLQYVKDENGKPIYRMPEGNWFVYNYYGDEKDYQTYFPLGSIGLHIDF